MSTFDLKKLLQDVFAPHPGETAIILTDIPSYVSDDTPDWRERRQMAAEWRQGFLNIGIQCPAVMQYLATGANNADLPLTGRRENTEYNILDELSKADIVLAFTRYSATAPLSSIAHRLRTLRVASMPGVLRRMEQSALAADYSQVTKKADLLAAKLTAAESADILFSTGHTAHFDLRHRTGEADNGRCHRDQAPHLINLPSGEGFIVPYEGEKDGVPSQTAGIIPIQRGKERILLHIHQNKIQDIEGNGEKADQLRIFFDKDHARRNIAELGLGCNDRAIVTGNVLEDEKAGMHWAYGRSEHLGGTVGPDSFTCSAHVVHNDIVYATQSPIGVRQLILNTLDAPPETIMQDSCYTVFD